jgi:hypothetical protein
LPVVVGICIAISAQAVDQMVPSGAHALFCLIVIDPGRLALNCEYCDFEPDAVVGLLNVASLTLAPSLFLVVSTILSADLATGLHIIQ